MFLYEILRIGLDCRNEGISWVIRVLWGYGEKVNLDQLPKFLDQKAKEFLLLKSQKLQELQEIETIKNFQLDLYKTNTIISDQQCQDNHISPALGSSGFQMDNILSFEQSNIEGDSRSLQKSYDKDNLFSAIHGRNQ